VSGGRQGRRFAALPRTSAPWLLVTLSLFLISSCSNNSRSAPSATATTTTATYRDPPLQSATVATARLRAALAHVSALTALGDSVPDGTACNCTPYPQLTAAYVASITRHAVKGFWSPTTAARASEVAGGCDVAGGSVGARTTPPRAGNRRRV
jgi:hypothetical protein